MAESHSAVLKDPIGFEPDFRVSPCQQLGLSHAGATTRCPSLQKRSRAPVSLILESLLTIPMDGDQQVYHSGTRRFKGKTYRCHESRYACH